MCTYVFVSHLTDHSISCKILSRLGRWPLTFLTLSACVFEDMCVHQSICHNAGGQKTKHSSIWGIFICLYLYDSHSFWYCKPISTFTLTVRRIKRSLLHCSDLPQTRANAPAEISTWTDHTPAWTHILTAFDSLQFSSNCYKHTEQLKASNWYLREVLSVQRNIDVYIKKRTHNYLVNILLLIKCFLQSGQKMRMREIIEWMNEMNSSAPSSGQRCYCSATKSPH